MSYYHFTFILKISYLLTCNSINSDVFNADVSASADAYVKASKVFLKNLPFSANALASLLNSSLPSFYLSKSEINLLLDQDNSFFRYYSIFSNYFLTLISLWILITQLLTPNFLLLVPSTTHIFAAIASIVISPSNFFITPYISSPASANIILASFLSILILK